MWAPPPHERPQPGWWHELSLQRWIDGVAADMREAEEAKDRAKRLRRLRREAERASEQIVLALGADEARQHLRRQGYWHGYERSADHHGYADESYRGVPVEHSAPRGRVLRVR